MTTTTVSMEVVKTSCVVNGALLLASLCLFEALLRWPATRRVVAPRFTETAGASVALLVLIRRVFEELGRPTDHDPDAAVMVRFCQLGFRFSVCGTLLDIMLLPMYYTGSGSAEGYNRFTLANLAPGSPRFWGVVLSAYVLTGIFAHLVLAEWRKFIGLRRVHFARVTRGLAGAAAAQARHSLVVEGLSPDDRNVEVVRNFFEKLFGHGSVHSCAMQGDTLPLYRLMDLRNTSRRCCCRDAPPLAAEFAMRLDNTIHREVAMMQAPMLQPCQASMAREVGQRALGVAQLLQDATVGRSASSTAFVTLRSAARCVEAQQVLLSHTKGWKVLQAPEPRDLIWRNVSKPLEQVELRGVIAKGICAVGLLFWSVPISLITAWTSAGFLAEWSSRASPLLKDYLPVLALIGLQAMLPYIFEWMARSYEGRKCKSEVARILLNRCFGYQLASLYVTVFLGSLWESLQEVMNSPKEGLLSIGRLVPQGSVYFVTFVLARAGFSLPLLFLRPAALLNLRNLDTAPEPAHCNFGGEAANLALVFVIGLTYSFVAPAILPVCALYFALATTTYRWLFTCVYEPEFDSSGSFWYDLFNGVMLGLFLGTLSLVALATSFGNAYQVAAISPLPILVLMLGAYCWVHLGSASKLVSLEDAVAADECELQNFDLNFYGDPIALGYSDSMPGHAEESAPLPREVAS